MKNHNLRLFILVPFVFSLISCTAGGASFSADDPAGFWFGIWHGIISVISLVIHIFNESVVVYETHNTGGWYDFGFLLGVISIWGGSSHANCKSVAKKQREKEWEEISGKVENKVMRKLKAWAEDEDTDPVDEWDEIGEKVEKKLKRKIRDWAEKD